MTTQRLFIGIGVVVALLGAGSRARATLGEPQATVDRDREALAMVRGPATARSGVTVHELRGATVVVREFADPSGTVFAVTWAGLARPDLAPLLGTYDHEYRAAASGPRNGRGPRRVRSAHLVVETWGHARDLHGRAYVPSLVPQRVNLDEVR
ncbi:DUF2844 domain-containing protein [Anaeromyxobacter oryzae]|uniref:DUF2844 domain-containing protein n=1 Tax=Anaeromyxobacter oryzae TaxID=2918170 RepID=A0ABM7WZX1_9BACT|nr:DUF2844 domain-containing protein [Anaeromyxobacter oryzae]BDG05094.1 hypothetical protein AMOR_40900 [Anaeromyxobacter oryzae]